VADKIPIYHTASEKTIDVAASLANSNVLEPFYEQHSQGQQLAKQFLGRNNEQGSGIDIGRSLVIDTS